MADNLGQQTTSPTGKFLFDIPTGKGFAYAGFAILICVVVAFGLYAHAGKQAEFGVKVADFLLQGALVTLFFAILKTIIDEAKAFGTDASGIGGQETAAGNAQAMRDDDGTRS